MLVRPRERGRRLRPDPGRRRGRPAVHRRDERRCSRELTGAARVFMLGGGKKRYGESADRQARAADEREAGALPARRQHRRLGASELVDLFAHVRRRPRPRRLLALGACTTCGARSRHRRRTSRSRCATRGRSTPADEVTVTAITEERQGDIVHDTMSYVYNPAHRWYYFRDMTRDEVIVFKADDTDPRRARSAWRTPRSPIRPARRAYRRGRASRCAASRCSTDGREDHRAGLTVDEVVERAQALTDVADPDPTHFARQPRPRSSSSMNDEAALTPEGVGDLVGDARGRAAQPHRGRRVRRRHPEVDDVAARARRSSSPGCRARAPRTSSTCSTRTRDLRMLRTWEGERPVAAAGASTPSRPRGGTRRASRTRGATHEATGGKIDAFHLTDVDGPQECLAILDQTFVNPGLLWTMSVFGLPRVPAARRRPPRGVRVPRPRAAAPAVGRARAAGGR